MSETINFVSCHEFWILWNCQKESLLIEEQYQQLKELLKEYSDVFALSDSELGCTDLVKHFIDTSEHRPIKQRPYTVQKLVYDYNADINAQDQNKVTNGKVVALALIKLFVNIRVACWDCATLGGDCMSHSGSNFCFYSPKIKYTMGGEGIKQLDYEADINAQDTLRNTALLLHLAAKCGQTSVLIAIGKHSLTGHTPSQERVWPARLHRYLLWQLAMLVTPLFIQLHAGGIVEALLE